MVKSVLGTKLKVCGSSSIDNLGTFASDNINTNELVFVKGGHILTRQEMYSLSKIDGYWPIDDQYVLAAKNEKEFSEVKLYINHSCSPNCGIRGDIVGIAMRDIGVGEEITFDYAFLDNEYNRFKCACKSENCRHIITSFDWQIKDIQDKYGQYFVAYLKEKIEKGFYYEAYTELSNTMRALRTGVFVNELGFDSSDEFDGEETDYRHCCLYVKNELAAYARVKFENNTAHISRLIVRKEERGKGYGKQIMFWAETEALKAEINQVYVHSLVDRVSFYAKLGYQATGAKFFEDGVEHIKMTKELTLN